MRFLKSVFVEHKIQGGRYGCHDPKVLSVGYLAYKFVGYGQLTEEEVGIPTWNVITRRGLPQIDRIGGLIARVVL